MSLVPVLCRELSLIPMSNNSIELSFNTQITSISRPIPFPRKMMNDISENPSWSPLSCPVPLLCKLLSLALIVRATLVSPQESVLSRYYRHERPIVICNRCWCVQSNQWSMDNSQGKCGRYKIKLRLNAHWSNRFMNLPCSINGQMRRRIVAAPNDNSDGKLSRFKGLAIVRVQTFSSRIIEYTIAWFRFPLPPSLVASAMKLRWLSPCRLAFKSFASSPSILCTNSTLRFPPAPP